MNAEGRPTVTTEPSQEAEEIVREHHQAWVLYQDARTASNLQALEDSTARLVDVLAAAIEYREAEREHDQDRITPLAIKLDETLSALREDET